jgi:hypothetical protein
MYPLLSALTCLLMALSGAALATPLKWAVYDSNKAPVESFFAYDAVVFNTEYHPPLAPLRQRRKQVYGYLNLGEMPLFDPAFQEADKAGAVLVENPARLGYYFVDIRNPSWAKNVIGEVIPRLLHDGFNGLYLEDMEPLFALERADPVGFRGMRAAAIALVKNIHRNYPDLPILLNRNQTIVPFVASVVDGLVVDSRASLYDPHTRRYVPSVQAVPASQTQRLRNLAARYPNLQIITLNECGAKAPVRAAGATPAQAIRLSNVVRSGSERGLN